MKRFLVAISLFAMSSLALADGKIYNPEAIYQALDVQPVRTNPGIMGKSMMLKSVGGLKCTKSTLVVRNPIITYSCELSTHLVARNIYKALRVKAVMKGTEVMSKSVGGLTCNVAGFTQTYSCVLELDENTEL